MRVSTKGLCRFPIKLLAKPRERNHTTTFRQFRNTIHIRFVPSVSACFILFELELVSQAISRVTKIFTAAALHVSQGSYFILKNAESIYANQLSTQLSETPQKP